MAAARAAINGYSYNRLRILTAYRAVRAEETITTSAGHEPLVYDHGKREIILSHSFRCLSAGEHAP
jgi:hypothetical protein